MDSHAKYSNYSGTTLLLKVWGVLKIIRTQLAINYTHHGLQRSPTDRMLCLPSLAFRYTVFATMFSNSMSSSLPDFTIPGPISTLSHQNVYFGRGVVERGRWRPRPSPETSIFIAWILITCHRRSLMNWLYYTWLLQVPL